LMDYLKSRAPFWKKEVVLGHPDGAWVDSKVIDETALKAWSN
jgi:molybdopterin synthase catalytic subunit